MSVNETTPLPFSMPRRGWGLLLGLLLGSAGAAQAGTLTPGLQNIVNDPAFANLRIPVIVRFTVSATQEQQYATDFQNAVNAQATIASKKAAGYNKARQQRDALLSSIPCGQAQSIQQVLTAGVASGAAINVYAGVMSRVVTLKAKPALITQLKGLASADLISLAGTVDYTAPAVTPTSTEWNITSVGAPAVCNPSTLVGQCGRGAVVGVIGTGANMAHQDLAPRCQGGSKSGQTCLGLGNPEACESGGGYCVGAEINRATGAAYWQDVTATPQATPYDDDGSGTHLVGVAVGRNGVGVAPAAQWIACRAFVPLGGGDLTLDRGFGQINECIDYLMNPDGVPGDMLEQHALHAADVILLPYPLSTPLPDTPTSCRDNADTELQKLQMLMAHLRGINVTPVVAVGDGGGSGVPLPAAYRPAFAVGMTQDVDGTPNPAQDSSSPAGTTVCLDDGVTNGAPRPSPALLAPGINVRAPGMVVGSNVNAYEVRRGAAVAAAHVTGAVALLRGASADIHMGRPFGDDLHFAADEILVRSATNYQAGPFRPGRLNLSEAFKDRAEPLQDTLSYPNPFYTDAHLSGTAVFRNISPFTWTRAAGVQLAAVPGADNWGVSALLLPPPPSPLVLPDPSTIRPGETATFNLTGTAPHVDGTYAHQYQLVRGTTPFPASPASTTQTQARNLVVTGINASVVSSITIIRQDNQAALTALPTPGLTARITMIVRNSGTKTWQQGTHRLGSQGPQDNTFWGTNRLTFVNNNGSCPQTTVKPSCAVASCTTFDPCAYARFTIDVTGPTACAGYLGKSFDWEMVEDGLEWFGPHAIVNIPSYDVAWFGSQVVPGGDYTQYPEDVQTLTAPYQAQVWNCGTNVWGSGYSGFAYVEGGPVSWTPTGVVAPGGSFWMAGNTTLPNAPGRHASYIGLIQPGGAWVSWLAGSVGETYRWQYSSTWDLSHVNVGGQWPWFVRFYNYNANSAPFYQRMTFDLGQGRWEGLWSQVYRASTTHFNDNWKEEAQLQWKSPVQAPIHVTGLCENDVAGKNGVRCWVSKEWAQGSIDARIAGAWQSMTSNIDAHNAQVPFDFRTTVNINDTIQLESFAVAYNRDGGTHYDNFGFFMFNVETDIPATPGVVYPVGLVSNLDGDPY